MSSTPYVKCTISSSAVKLVLVRIKWNITKLSNWMKCSHYRMLLHMAHYTLTSFALLESIHVSINISEGIQYIWRISRVHHGVYHDECGRIAWVHWGMLSTPGFPYKLNDTINDLSYHWTHDILWYTEHPWCTYDIPTVLMMYCAVLCCAVLVLFCTMLCCSVLCCTVLNILWYTAQTSCRVFIQVLFQNFVLLTRN